MGDNNSKLTPDDINDLKELQYTEKEIKQWYKNFQKECPSGHITKKEFKQLYGSFFPKGDSTKFAEHVFRTYDSDGDEKLNFREFIGALSITTKGSMEQKLNWAFSLYDLDGNGFIAKDEMLEIFKALYKMFQNDQKIMKDNLETPEKRLDHVFEKMDLNKDGQISKEEFIEGVKNDDFMMRVLKSD